MKRVLLLAALLLIGAGGYIASPFWAAWSLREAIKSGDTATIERMVVWDSVRESLRTSIARQNQLVPEANALGAAVTPTLWQRVKNAFGATMLDRFVETYVTPEGLPKLFRYRKTWTETVKGGVDEDKLPLTERVQRFYSRIHRAEFQTPTRVEIEMQDKDSPDRRYVSVMELDGFAWKLTSLKIAAPGAAAPAATSQLLTQ